MQPVLFVLKTLVVTTTPKQRQLTNNFRSQIGNGKVCVCVCNIMYDTHVLNLHLLYTKPRVSQSNNCVQLCEGACLPSDLRTCGIIEVNLTIHDEDLVLLF